MRSGRPQLGIVGCGDISLKNHIPHALSTEWQIRSLCDTNAQNAQAAATLCGSQGPVVFGDCQSMLADSNLDAVIIATPPVSHAPLTIAALRAGKHVLCEKPSALTVAENRQILDESARHPTLTVQFFSSRFRDQSARRARDIVRAGALGAIYHADIQFSLPAARACDIEAKRIDRSKLWFGRRDRSGGGPFMDMGQYFLDRLLYILDWPKLQRISAQAFRGHPTGLEDESMWDVEDHMTLQARLGDQLTLTMDTTARSYNHWRWGIHIHGTRGTIILDNTRKAPFEFISEDPQTKELCAETFSPSDKTPDLCHRLADLQAIMGGEAREYGTTANQALQLTDFCMRAYRSSELAREVGCEERIE